MADTIHVLYVDDEPALLDIGKRYLERLGNLSVTVVNSASEGLDLLQNNHFDAIISDYQMPGTNGLEFLKQVRIRFGQIPFILFTGKGREEVVILALNEGADFYLQKGGEPKPQFAELAHKIRQSLERRWAESALVESENLYRTIFEMTGAATILIDNNAVITRANSGFAELSGYSIEELEGKMRWTDFVVEEDLKRMIQYHKVRRAEADSAPKVYEFCFHARSGEIRHCINNVALIPGTTLSVASVVDISARAEMEQILRVSENLYRTIFETTGAATLIIAPDTTVLIANAGWEKLTGIPREELGSSMSWTRFIHPDDVERLKAYHYARRDDPASGPKVYECRVIDIYGVIHHCVVYTDMIPGSQNSVASLVDISNRILAETALKESEEKFRALVEQSLDGIVIVNFTGTLLFTNRRAEEITETDALRNLVGTNILTFIAPEMQESAILDLAQVASGIDGYQVNYKIITFAGHERWIGCIGKRISFEGSSAMLLSIRDITDQKLTQEALIESEERYRNVVEDQTEFISRFLPDGTHIFVNEAYCRYFGTSREEIIGRRFIPEIPREDLLLVREHFASLTPDNPTAIITHRISMPDGKIRWQRWSDRAIFDDLGAVIEYQSVGYDISGMKKMEKALQESEAMYRLLEGQLPDYVIIHDGETIQFVNAEGARLMGRTSEEIIGTSIFSYVDPEYHDLIRRNMGLRYQGSHIDPYEIRVMWPSGGHQWVEVRATPIPNPDKSLILTVLTDITKRKHAEAGLIESEANYRTIIEKMQDLFYRADLEGNIIMISPIGAKLAGYASPDEVIGKNIHDLYVDPQEREQFLAELDEKGEVNDYPLALIANDGTFRYATASSHFYHDAEGRVIGVEGILHDVTERRRAEEALIQANRKLNLLSSITRHDINNQLMILQGYLEVLEQEESDPTLKRYSHNAGEAAQHIASMILFMKEYETIGITEPVWLNARDIVQISGNDSPIGQKLLKNDLPPDVEVFADPLMVKVCYNLMDNAVRYGGKITLIRFSGQERAEDLIIVCEDDGVGVDNGDKEKIFERGYGKNTGLGLALSREILNITGIIICETGRPGRGARFEMTVPKGAWRIRGEET
ncbi:MAG TPA: PAS domain S-box protein [Methanospirillum sp.]|nr:PAS domain S-box protein [Methanospirillum sp.]